MSIDILEELRGKDPNTIGEGRPDELKGKTPAELRAFVQVLDAHLRDLHQTEEGELRDKSPDEQTAFDYGLVLRDKAIDLIERDAAVQDIFRRKPKSVQTALANLNYGAEDSYGDVRRLNNAEARDRALRLLDDRNSASHLRSDEKDHVELQIRRNPTIARRILVTENEDYRNAWLKMVTDPNAAGMLSEDERQALRSWNEYRAASEGTTTAGGFGVPVFIDPSIIMTAQGSGNPFLSISRQININTNVWKGVSSAGVSWSFDSEAAAVSDDSPTLAQPIVTVFMARGFIPYSIEVGMDYQGFASEMQGLLAAGYDELLVDKFTRGSGTGEPKGILTCLSANTNVRVKVNTNPGISINDPYNVWQAVPQRNRRNASWLMNVAVNNAIRQLGTANVYHGYTVNLPQGAAEELFNSPVYESPYMPTTTTVTTATEGYAIVGDFSNYVIARNGGMSVELIPQIFQQATAGSAYGMPTGQRGWFAYSRIGASSANDLGFRLLVSS